MDHRTALQLTQRILSLPCGCAPDAIRPELLLREELGLDSVDAAELLIVLEEKSGLRFELTSLDGIATVGDIVQQICAVDGVIPAENGALP
jgi:acyl carrier protein